MNRFLLFLRRFSSKVLTVFCQQTENRPLAGIIVIGEGQSARAVALAGTAMKLPVLWAKGGTASLNGKHKEVRRGHRVQKGVNL